MQLCEPSIYQKMDKTMNKGEHAKPGEGVVDVVASWLVTVYSFHLKHHASAKAPTTVGVTGLSGDASAMSEAMTEAMTAKPSFSEESTVGQFVVAKTSSAQTRPRALSRGTATGCGEWRMLIC